MKLAIVVTVLRRIVLASCASLLAVPAHAAPATPGSLNSLDNSVCLQCHGAGKPGIEVKTVSGDPRTLRAFDPAAASKGVHVGVQCIACHTDIVDSKEKHQKATGAKPPECASCHLLLWESARQNTETMGRTRLKTVVDNVSAYRDSFHARPDADHPDRAKAVCSDCHNTHEFAVPAAGTQAREEWRATIPKTCGEKCHEDQLEDFVESVHGKALLETGDMKSASCVDCHTTHQIVGASSTQFKLQNVESCGDCHRKELHSYRDTYHGQINKLGYTTTAKCSDCHGSHGVKGSDDPDSKVHPDNKLKTCQKCHNDKKPGMVLATKGFATFYPHASGDDFKKYPEMWIATKFMTALLIGVFAFFWLHCGLWYYREWQDRKAGRGVPHVKTAALGVQAPEKHFRRFPWGWRLAHLVFALVTMTLVLTGTTVMFSHALWADNVAQLFGGPKRMGLVHRVAAALFIGIFFVHFVYVMQRLLRDREFRWFGPDSLIPRWKDLTDCWQMFVWFVGKGPRPQFDRWTYFEKFDYWAVFWGVNVIGWSGMMLAFPHVTATYLPGWVFNVATLVHGEEAFLAAVFLFTVHFFNNHFRPDKLPPPDVVMFTGTQSLEEFRKDHPAHYQRLADSGELEKYLVDAPSKQMHLGSVVLGLALISLGLALLVMVAVGFFGHA